ncbi:hypothetical protein KCU90_g3596, partial [Aureobasidium melanogenum]
MPLSRSGGAPMVAALDSVVQLAMLLARVIARMARRIGPLRATYRHQLAAQEIMERDEILVLGGCRNGPVKRNVGRGSRVEIKAFLLHFANRIAHTLKIFRRTPTRRGHRRLGFDPQTHFEQLREIQLLAAAARQPENRTRWRLRNKRPGAAPRNQYAVRLQLRNCLAYD